MRIGFLNENNRRPKVNTVINQIHQINQNSHRQFDELLETIKKSPLLKLPVRLVVRLVVCQPTKGWTENKYIFSKNLGRGGHVKFPTVGAQGPNEWT